VTERLGKKTPPLRPFKYWVANVSLGLTVTSTEGTFPNSSGLTLAVIDPLKLANNSFGFGANPVLYQQRQRLFTLDYTVEIEKIDPSHCATKHWHAFNLEGDLGLRDQIYTGLHSIIRSEADELDTSKTGSTPDSFGGTVSFEVFKGIESGGPVFTLTRFKGPTGGLGILREDKHSVAVTFVPVSTDTTNPKIGTTSLAKNTASIATGQLVMRGQLNTISSNTSKQ
jgi:hypothetical protein